MTTEQYLTSEYRRSVGDAVVMYRKLALMEYEAMVLERRLNDAVAHMTDADDIREYAELTTAIDQAVARVMEQYEGKEFAPSTVSVFRNAVNHAGRSK